MRGFRLGIRGVSILALVAAGLVGGIGRADTPSVITCVIFGTSPDGFQFGLFRGNRTDGFSGTGFCTFTGDPTRYPSQMVGGNPYFNSSGLSFGGCDPLEKTGKFYAWGDTGLTIQTDPPRTLPVSLYFQNVRLGRSIAGQPPQYFPAFPGPEPQVGMAYEGLPRYLSQTVGGPALLNTRTNGKCPPYGTSNAKFVFSFPDLLPCLPMIDQCSVTSRRA